MGSVQRSPQVRSIKSSQGSVPGMSNGDLNGGAAAKDPEDVPHPDRVVATQSLGTLRLAALLFFSVSGGPLGTEGLVKAAGPFWSIVGLCIWPIIWVCPVAFMTAELATAIPKDGGFVWWVDTAFGRFWGFMVGWISWAGGVVDNAIYPGMFLSFMMKTFDVELSSMSRQMVLICFNLLMTATNLVGIGVAGSASVVFVAIVMTPVAILVLVSLPNISVGAWFGVVPVIKYADWLNVIIWNTNRWESCSTYATQVANPIRTFPAAIFITGLAVIVPIMLCIMASTGVNQDYDSYENGTYNLVAKQEGGMLLGILFTIGTSAAACGMYVSAMSSYSYLLSGMAEEGMVPRVFATKLPHFGTPFVAIGLQFVVVVVLTNMEFHDILMCDNVLYCSALCMELCAMVKLRHSHPQMARPFRVPLGTTGVTLMCCLPTFFCLFLIFSSTAKVVAMLSVIIGMGVAIWYFTEHLRDGSGKLIVPFIDGSVQSYSAL